MKVFIFHHTQDCQDYNEHEVFATIEGAQVAFDYAYADIINRGIVTTVYTEDENTFYFETRDGQEKLYITEHEL